MLNIELIFILPVPIMLTYENSTKVLWLESENEKINAHKTDINMVNKKYEKIRNDLDETKLT